MYREAKEDLKQKQAEAEESELGLGVGRERVLKQWRPELLEGSSHPTAQTVSAFRSFLVAKASIRQWQESHTAVEQLQTEVAQLRQALQEVAFIISMMSK